MILKEEQKEQIIKYVPNGEKLIEGEDLEELLMAIDNVIIGKGMNQNYQINKLGVKLQNLYDDIYYQNE